VPNLTVYLTRPAVNDLEEISEPVRSRILNDISSLERDPFPAGQSKKLKGFKFPLFRLRAGNHRVLYRIDQDVVTVMRVIDRKDLEKTIRRLKIRGPSHL
jgi:mRNA-degrading endonuclease RelE of RelBE toxin-antitoxin system